MSVEVLEVDLTARSARRVPCERYLRDAVGGVGLAVALLDDALPGRVDPLGPENALVFASGPFADSPIPAATKHAVATISPLTGRVSDGLSSSHWSAALRRLGLAALVVRGQSASWSSIAVGREGVRFIDASTELGSSPVEAAARLKARLGDARWRIAAIGVAGERGVRFASIENDGRQAGRGGAGAVMGAKHLKAIALHDEGPQTTNAPEARALARALRTRMLGPETAKYRVLGTGANMRVLARMGMLPTRNFSAANFEGVERVTPERAREAPEEYREIRGGCVNCPVACEHMYVRRDRSGRAAAASEYESVWAFGPNCGIDDLDAVLDAIADCDRYGLDTISAGGAIAFAMDCARGGLVDPGVFGPALHFGNAAVLAPALEAIAHGDGFGATLALGVREAGERLGAAAAARAVHVKGLELPGYEPRTLPTYALALAVCTRGACHNRAAAYDVDLRGSGAALSDEQRAASVIDAEDNANLWDSLLLCKFVRDCFTDLAEEAPALLRAAGHGDTSPQSLREAARRTWARKRAINRRQGWSELEDALPERLHAPVASGPHAGARIDPARIELQRGLYERARRALPVTAAG